MERKRGLNSDDEEEEGRGNRRVVPRTCKRIRSDEEDEEKEEPGPSTRSNCNQENSLLNVTCGNLKGILDLEMLDRGELCINFKDCWVSPTGFEEMGGKGSHRKWKASIHYQNKPLQFWFEKWALTTKRFKGREREPTKHDKNLLPDHESERSSEGSETPRTEEDDKNDEDWPPVSGELLTEKEEGEVGAETEGEAVDSSDDENEDEEDDVDDDDDDDDDDDVSEVQKNALKRNVKVVIKRLPEALLTHLSNSKEGSHADNLQLFKDEEGEEEYKEECQDDDSITKAPPIAPDSDPIICGINGQNTDENSTPSESDEDRQQEARCSPTSPSATSPLEPDGLNPAKDAESSNKHTADLLVTVTQTLPACREKGKLQLENDAVSKEEAEVEEEETEGRQDDTSITTAIQKDQMSDPLLSNWTGSSMSRTKLPGSFSTPSPSGISPPLPSDFTGSWSGGPTQPSLETLQQQRVPQTVQSEEAEGSSACCDLDSLNQLKKEKIKMQLKVLRLQEEYYTLKIQKYKQ